MEIPMTPVPIQPIRGVSIVYSLCSLLFVPLFAYKSTDQGQTSPHAPQWHHRTTRLFASPTG
jgi:hypothetical protein